jgi:hypothetical protein
MTTWVVKESGVKKQIFVGNKRERRLVYWGIEEENSFGVNLATLQNRTSHFIGNTLDMKKKTLFLTLKYNTKKQPTRRWTPDTKNSVVYY